MHIYMSMRIRKGTFETNSSSVHSLVVCKGDIKDIPDSIMFDLGEFGWEQSLYADRNVKATYINTALWQYFVEWNKDKTKYYEYQKKITDILKSCGVEASWKDIEKLDKNDFYFVDHVTELITIINDFIETPELLIKWLCNGKSLLITDNDNDGCEFVSEYSKEYAGNPGYEIFWKSN